MIVILRPFAMTGVLTTACIVLLVLLSAYFKAFLAPEPVNPFEVNYPVSFPQLDSYSAIAVSWVLEV